ncbi:hypothetical protein V502_11016 [Pseudogymnoascus sp. VKM F-4520 (FW-2644)]|nr:hypothetical protein V502_11016 [Pseudogymnoascus sp. VKM F-4520 (FW-2644)]
MFKRVTRRLSRSSSDLEGHVPLDINKSVMTDKPLLVIAGSSEIFDRAIIERWTDEGFDVHYEHVHGDSRSSTFAVEAHGDTLESGESYAIVAYDHAASVLMDKVLHARGKLCAMVAFYPPTLPDPAFIPPPNVRLQVHLAGNQPFAPKYPHFSYEETLPGFDELDSSTYNRIASGLAWSRALDCIRRGFGIDVDLEDIWERHLSHEFVTRNAVATIGTMTSNPSVVHIPTLTGGVGQRELLRFYDEFFIPSNPPNMRTKLLSRTVGSDKIIDEMLISFTHTQEIPWLLPGVPPTRKYIEFVLVSVVKIIGGKLESERLHWDQASVLVQAGLLDARLGAIGLGESGVRRLPIVGAEASRIALGGDERAVALNELIPEW